MDNILVDLSKKVGVVKPMHALNNGPNGAPVRGVDNLALLREAQVPYSRNHDASFMEEHLVDVHRIFKNFDADENDPANYCFGITDYYVSMCAEAGMEVFYRLGASIEHTTPYGTFPPKDNAKWARICEHIIRHYNEGWADGFHYGIRYWEIWNEPDCYNGDGSNPCWQGTPEQFAELFVTALKHLKRQFPQLKIGGPALCTPYSDAYNALLLPRLKQEGVELDFYSYHCYCKEPQQMREAMRHVRQELDKYGFEKTEAILNEWNYIRGWTGEDWKASLRTEKNLKGAAFIVGCMCVGQSEPCDMLMYYDGRACGMCGLFDTDTLEALKGYYPFPMFASLYRLGNAVEVKTDCDNLFCAAAADGFGAAVLLTHYEDDDTAPAREVKLTFANADAGKKKVDYYLLDEAHDCKLVREEIFTAEEFGAYLDVPLFTSYLIKVSAMNE